MKNHPSFDSRQINRRTCILTETLRHFLKNGIIQLVLLYSLSLSLSSVSFYVHYRTTWNHLLNCILHIQRIVYQFHLLFRLIRNIIDILIRNQCCGISCSNKIPHVKLSYKFLLFMGLPNDLIFWTIMYNDMIFVYYTYDEWNDRSIVEQLENEDNEKHGICVKWRNLVSHRKCLKLMLAIV